MLKDQPEVIWIRERENWQYLSDGKYGTAHWVKPYKDPEFLDPQYIRADRVEKLLEALKFYEPYEMEDTTNALRRVPGHFNDEGKKAKQALEEYYGEKRPMGTVTFTQIDEIKK